MPPLTWRQVPIDQRANADAHKTLNRVTNFLTHSTYLSVSTLMNHHAQDTGLQLTDIRGRRHSVIKLNAISHPTNCGVVHTGGRTFDMNQILFFQAITRMRNSIGEFTIIGEQQ
jgi:hypothetical protein